MPLPSAAGAWRGHGCRDEGPFLLLAGWCWGAVISPVGRGVWGQLARLTLQPLSPLYSSLTSSQYPSPLPHLLARKWPARMPRAFLWEPAPGRAQLPGLVARRPVGLAPLPCSDTLSAHWAAAGVLTAPSAARRLPSHLSPRVGCWKFPLARQTLPSMWFTFGSLLPHIPWPPHCVRRIAGH